MNFWEFVDAHPGWTFLYLIVIAMALVGIAEGLSRFRKK